MASGSAWIAAFSIGTLLVVSGCDEFEGITPKPEEGEASAEQQVRSVMQDVERPDIFSVTESALWDGRPSLGGIWVAHPDVKEPERALITNTKTGKQIAGALFRRERDNPGPRIQLSSDAAAALGILAGQPTELTVIAVRQEEVIIEPDPVISEEVVGEDGAQSVDAPPEAARVDDSDGTGVVAAAGAGAAVAANQAPRRQGFWGRFRDSLRNKPKEPTAASVAADADTGTVPEVETQTLDPVTTGAAAAIAAAEADDKPVARPERTAAAEPAPAPAASTLKNPFIQVGLFSVEENAAAAASTLREAGIVPTIIPGNNRWRVVVGPMATPDDQAALLGKIRGLGYSDAFLSPN
ncbi:MAG: SPOR domain-containing protein [Silicimonas sp.]|nr:SPOR domain-containing protein [Silicimonas sp.]